MIARGIHCGLCKCINSGPRSRAAAPRKPYRRRWTQAWMLECLNFSLHFLYSGSARLSCSARPRWREKPCVCSPSMQLPSHHYPPLLNDFSEKRYAHGWKKYLHYTALTEERDVSAEWTDAMLSTSDILICTMCPVHNIWGAVCVFAQSNLREALLFLWLDIDLNIKNYSLWCIKFTCTL